VTTKTKMCLQLHDTTVPGTPAVVECSH